MDQLRDQGLFAVLTVDRLDVERVVLLDQQTAAAQTLEKWLLQTYRASAPTDAPQSELAYEGRMIYGMVYRDGRWKVERLRPPGKGSP